MNDRISILVGLVPEYGTILLGVGSILLTQRESLLENLVAMEKVKQYLLEVAVNKRDLSAICECEIFQRIMYDYTGTIVNMGVLRDLRDKCGKVNILLVDFFKSVIWPIIVPRYIDELSPDIDRVNVKLNIKKNVFMTIYGEENSDLFFKEFKEYLLYNNIIISEAVKQDDGNLLVNLLIPVPPYSKN